MAFSTRGILRVLVGLGLAAQVGACAVAAEPDGGMTGSGGTFGAGGGVFGAGGALGAGGTYVGTGGAYAGTGGVSAGTGGAVAGTGGSTGGGTPVPSTFANNGYGTSGAWHGYVFTAAELATITPPCGASACFEAAGANLCASGSINAAEAGFAMIGFNVNQADAEPNPAGTWTTTGTGVSVNVANLGAATPMRIKVTVGSTDYCTDLSSTGGQQSIPWTAFKTTCWNALGTQLPASSAITSVAVQVPGKLASATPFNLCLVSIAPY